MLTSCSVSPGYVLGSIDCMWQLHLRWRNGNVMLIHHSGNHAVIKFHMIHHFGSSKTWNSEHSQSPLFVWSRSAAVPTLVSKPDYPGELETRYVGKWGDRSGSWSNKQLAKGWGQRLRWGSAFKESNKLSSINRPKTNLDSILVTGLSDWRTGTKDRTKHSSTTLTKSQ